MKDIIRGVLEFQNRGFSDSRELFAGLAKQQNPDILFLTCSDSRVHPHLITGTGPGDLFICRNAGNLVPPQPASFADGTVASVEFALTQLSVSHIIVCGHTDCGAMKGLLYPDRVQDLKQVQKWLAFAEPALLRLQEAEQHLDEKLSDDDRLLRLTEQNVLMQLEHLLTHPEVAAGVEAGRLFLHGWMYRIATGEVTAFDEAAGCFVPVAERYSEWLE